MALLDTFRTRRPPVSIAFSLRHIDTMPQAGRFGLAAFILAAMMLAAALRPAGAAVATTTAMNSSLSPSNYGQTVRLKATIKPTDVTTPLNGTIKFEDTTHGTTLATLSATALTQSRLAAGGNFACSLDVNGGVWCWGANLSGQLGTGTTTVSDKAIRIIASGATAIAAGYAHACALLNTGVVQCWGSNSAGQLGTGNTNDALTPTNSLVTGATAIAAGDYITCAIVGGGAVKCWGTQTAGLGDGASTASTMPVTVSGISGATALAGGGYHMCAVVSGNVRCWGYNNAGQLGNGTTTDSATPVQASGLSGAVSVAAGGIFTCATLSNGTVQCWGGANNVSIGTNNTASTYKIPQPVVGISSGATAIAAGDAHICAVVSSAIQCWGSNVFGQLGNGTTSSTNTPTANGVSGATALAAGRWHSCAVASGAVRCWGRGAYGQLGNQNLTPYAVPISVSGVSTVTQVVAGAHHSCAVIDGGSSGTLSCWGANNSNQLGSGWGTSSATPQAVTGIGPVVEAAAGQYHTCVRFNAGTVRCWGANIYGELGSGESSGVSAADADNVSGLSGVTAITAGAQHTCALASGAVYCWGYNAYGQLGDNTTTNRSVPVQAIASSAIAIVAGDYHTCAIISGGQARCWGANFYGQLGDGTTTQRTTPTNVSGVTTAASIAAGTLHSCAGLGDGSVKCWGYGSALGNGTGNDSTTPVTVGNLSGASGVRAGAYHTCALTGGGLKCWGSNASGQLGNGGFTNTLSAVQGSSLSSGVNSVTAGYGHTCIRTSTSTVKCWGYNGDGQVGNGSFTSVVTTAQTTAGQSEATATLVTTTLPVGTLTLKATYQPGDANTLASSITMGQTVNANTSTVAITSHAPNPSAWGQSITISAQVSPGSGLTAPTGNVSFKDGATVLGSAATDSNGLASFATSALGLGNRTLTAVYAGNGNFTGSTSAGVSHTVSKGVTSVSVATSPTPSLPGQPIAITATVSAAVGTPTGNVVFNVNGGSAIGIAALSGNSAAISFTLSTPGTYTIGASYVGDASFLSATGAVSHTVNVASTATTLASSANPGPANQAITLTATVTSANGTPSGSVTFRDNGATIGTGTLSGGVATFGAALTPGLHSLTASYEGDGTFSVSSSAALTQTALLGCSDSFGSAAALNGLSGMAAGSNAGAGGEGGEPNHAGNSAPLNSVWCAWQAPVSGRVSFDTTGSNFDTTLAVYTGSSVDQLTPVASNDNIAGNTLQSRLSFDAAQGTTYVVAIDGTGANTGNYVLTWAQTASQTLVASVLPSSRSVVTGTIATAFATVINSGGGAAQGCVVAPPNGFPGSYTFQTTDASNVPNGTPNAPVDIPAGAAQSFVFGVVPTIDLNSLELAMVFTCGNVLPAASVPGLDTLGLTASQVSMPDLIAIGATPSGDGIVTATPGAAAFFAASAINIGAGNHVVALVDDNGSNLPVTVTLCRTDPGTGVCIDPSSPGGSTTSLLATSEVSTYAVFIIANGPITFDPARNRLFIRFKTLDGVTRGATSVAIRTP